VAWQGKLDYFQLSELTDHVIPPSVGSSHGLLSAVGISTAVCKVAAVRCLHM
jgi:hypothetical protein